MRDRELASFLMCITFFQRRKRLLEGSGSCFIVFIVIIGGSGLFSRLGAVSRIFTVLHGALVTRLSPVPPLTPNPISLRQEEGFLFAKVSS